MSAKVVESSSPTKIGNFTPDGVHMQHLLPSILMNQKVFFYSHVFFCLPVYLLWLHILHCLVMCRVAENFSCGIALCGNSLSCWGIVPPSPFLSTHKETAILVRPSADRPEVSSAIFFSKLKLIFQLCSATFSTAFSTSFSLLLNRQWFMVGICSLLRVNYLVVFAPCQHVSTLILFLC